MERHATNQLRGVMGNLSRLSHYLSCRWVGKRSGHTSRPATRTSPITVRDPHRATTGYVSGTTSRLTVAAPPTARPVNASDVAGLGAAHPGTETSTLSPGRAIPGTTVT